MKKYIKLFSFFLMLFAIFFSIKSFASAEVTVKSFKYNSAEEVNTSDDFFSFNAHISPISEFIDQKGNYYVAYEGKKKFYIVKLKKSNMKVQKTITISKPYSKLGGVIMDKSGYFYALFGQSDTAEKGNKVTISIIQYNANGKKVKELAFKGNQTPDDYWGTRYPFSFGNASMTINDNLLAVTYAREMYNGHQSNYVIYIKIPSMVREKSLPEPYTSHSFDQRVITTKSKEFLFVDHGDAYPRGFHIQKVNKNNKDDSNTFKYVPFHFREGTNRDHGYNITFASLGGIGEISTGYVLAGSSNKTLSLEPIADDKEYEIPRDVFVQIFRKDYENYSDSKKQIINTTVRKATGKKNEKKSKTELFLSPGTKDYGVKWLTNYSKNELAANVKVVTLKNDQIFIMWEKYKNYDYAATYYAILNNKGTVLKTPTKLNVRLTAYEDPVYDGKYIYWTTRVKGKKQLQTYRLEISPLSVPSVDSNTTIIKGRALPKSQVKLIIGKKVKTTKSDAKGNYQFKISKQSSGTKIKITSVDNAGNSITKTITVKPYLKVNTVSDKSKKITGKTEAKATVKVYVKNKLIKSVKADKKGKFSVSIKKQKAGTSVKVIAAKNKQSKTVKTIVLDKTAPAKPKVTKVTSSTTKITGKTEPKATVYVYSGKKLLGKAAANSKGKFTVKISKQKKGTKLKILAKDKAGNKSKSVKVTVK